MTLEVKNLTKEYIRGRTAFRAVNNVSFVVRPGDFINIIGRSGSGKSTLVNMIACLLSPTEGSVEIDGLNITSLKDKEASVYRNSKIGYISQGQSTLASLNVLDNVRVPFHLSKRKGTSEEAARSLLEQTGIAHLSEAFPRHLSGGELKRVAIARALINQPDFVIADEPTSDLDVQTTAEIMNLLKNVAETGTAVIMITHDMEALEYGSRTFVMEAGILTERASDLSRSGTQPLRCRK